MAAIPRPTPTLSNCDTEPIHVPGLVQPHGLLFVLDAKTLVVKRCSANTEEILGVAPEQIVGTPIPDWLPPKIRSLLPQGLQPDRRQFSNPLHIPWGNAENQIDFDGIVHSLDDGLLLELEPATAESEDLVSARSLDHHFRLTEQAIPALQRESSVHRIAELMCSELRAFTGFDRVMLYRFAPDFHGEVIGEARRDDLEPFLGLHYPATDIPKQARELYKRNWVRLIHDVQATPVPLVPDAAPLDMSDCTLRAVSPIHIQYLKNMGVASSMSISLLDDGELWGLIACHHYSGPHFVPYAKRASCVHFGVVASSQMALRREQVAAQTLANRRAELVEITRRVSNELDFRTAMGTYADDLCKIVRADGVAVAIDGKWEVVSGCVPPGNFLDGLLADKPTLEENPEGITVTQHLAKDRPDLANHPSEAAGILFITLAPNWQIVMFRPEVRQTVRWSGNPNKAKESAEALTPRASFEEWSEEVRGQSDPWSKTDQTLARELRFSLLAFVVLRNHQLDQLNRQLIAKNAEVAQFAYSVSHDLKSPLVTVSGYIGALEEDLALRDDEAVNDSLDRIKRATARMGTLIEELLQFSRIGYQNGIPKTVDLDALIAEIRAEFEVRFQKVGGTLETGSDFPPIPGHPREIRRALHNLLDNALKYGRSTDPLRVTIGWSREPQAVRLFVRDNGPGIAPAYHERIFELFQRADDDTEGSGVGLASVTKVLQQHDGTCGVDSTEGHGAEFWMKFPLVQEKIQNFEKL
ncbi:MAG: ATP-binding protein [Chthoniobacterales bacterium]